jgi:sulfur carrier protein
LPAVGFNARRRHGASPAEYAAALFVYRHPRSDIYGTGSGELSTRGDVPRCPRLELSGRILFYWRAGRFSAGGTEERSLTTCPNDGREIIVNGDRLATRAQTLAELIAELGFAGKRVATARNGDFVAEGARIKTAIERGDRIEIVSARNGG